jgi:uncharacterized protein
MRARPGRFADTQRPDPAGLAALLILAGAGLSFGWLAYRGELDRLAFRTPAVEIAIELPGPAPGSIAFAPGRSPLLQPEPDRLASTIPESAPPAPNAETRPPIIRQAAPPAAPAMTQLASAPPAATSLLPAPAIPTPATENPKALNKPLLLPRAWPSVTAPAWQRFARPFDVNDPRPRIAIVILGLGLLHGETAAAIDELPSEVTLSFSPYSHGLDGWIGAARAYGHEVMLDLPPAAASDDASGSPQALPGDGSAAESLNRVDWVLARGQDYVGLAGTEGGPAGGLVLNDIGRHGLMFLAPAAGAGGVSQPGLASASADLSIDEHPDRDFIDGQLAELERRARATGFAVGVAYGYPVTIERLALWSRGLEKKNLALAPVSALVGQQAAR